MKSEPDGVNFECLKEAREQPGSAAWRRVLDRIMRENYEWISRFCLYELGDSAQALDCVQEIMMEISKSIHRFDGRSELRTWIYVIVRRRVARTRSITSRLNLRFPLGREGDVAQQEQADDPIVPGAEAAMILSEQNSVLLKAVKRLPEKQRHAVVLFYFEDLSLDETAKRLGVSSGTVKAHLFRARKTLGKELSRNNFVEMGREESEDSHE